MLMKKTTMLLAGAALLGSVGVAGAQDLDRGVPLTAAQMNGVTAAWGSFVLFNRTNVNFTKQKANAHAGGCFVALCKNIAVAANSNSTYQSNDNNDHSNNNH